MKKYVNSYGQTIFLDKKLGEGGEGEIYSILNDRSLVAKIYKEKISIKKEYKLRQMLKISTKQIDRYTAWPIDLLYDPHNKSLCGIIMKNISRYVALHEVYNIRYRLENIPHYSWEDLIKISINIASAFREIHQAGHIIGDVNENLVLVNTNNNQVKLVDCDSFQIYSNKTLYPCDVVTENFTPPELQGVNIKNVTRTTNHDNFGLAVLIFHLLIMGRHPYTGIFPNNISNQINSNIKKFLYPYAENSYSLEKNITPPPNTITPKILLPVVIQELFLRAFSEQNKTTRPTVNEWIEKLNSLQSKSIKSCDIYKYHKYYSRLDSCPWCMAKNNWNINYFCNKNNIKSVIRDTKPISSILTRKVDHKKNTKNINYSIFSPFKIGGIIILFMMAIFVFSSRQQQDNYTITDTTSHKKGSYLQQETLCSDGYLNSSQIEKLVTGNIAYGQKISGKKTHNWSEYQAIDGTSIFKKGNKTYYGKWKVKGDSICWCYGNCLQYNCKYIESTTDCSVWYYIDIKTHKRINKIYKWSKP